MVYLTVRAMRFSKGKRVLFEAYNRILAAFLKG